MTSRATDVPRNSKKKAKVASHSYLGELESKIDSITRDVSKPYYRDILKRLALKSRENATIIYDYILAEQAEINIMPSTKEGKIKVLVWLSERQGNKSFRLLTKEDILGYLNSLRNAEAKDPRHRWVGTYNGRQRIFSKFFRWLHNPNEPNPRLRVTPACMLGVKQLPRKEKSPYRPSDLWEPKEHSVFLKYCPNKRDKPSSLLNGH